MMCDRRHLPGPVFFLVVLAALFLGNTPARAQWGFGYGWGGFGGFNYVPSPSTTINDITLSNARRAGPPAPNRPYAGSTNAYFNNVRDNGFVPRYDVAPRRLPGNQSAPRSMGEQGPRVEGTNAQAAAPRPKPVIPLFSFFNAAWELIWPAEAPVGGDLKAKRDVSDRASLAVLEETRQGGFAKIATVADARQKLLDYGRPALQESRATATPRIADTFHLFLLSLYDSLGQAAAPAELASQTAPSR